MEWGDSLVAIMSRLERGDPVGGSMVRLESDDALWGGMTGLELDDSLGRTNALIDRRRRVKRVCTQVHFFTSGI